MKIVNVGKEGIYIHLYGDSGGWISLNIYSIKELRHTGNQNFVTIVNARNDTLALKATDIEDPDNPGSKFDWQGLWDWIIGAVPPVTEVPRDGLILEWLFCQDTEDTSPSGNDGFIKDINIIKSTQDRFSIDNAAYENTLNSPDSYIRSINNIGISGNAARSFSWWALINNIHANPGYMWLAGELSSNHTLICYIRNNNIYLGKWNGRNGWIPNTWDNQWHHYTIVYEGTIFNTVKLYQDGVELPKIQVGNPEQLATIDNGFIIFNRPNVTQAILGKMDDIRIYDRALTEAEITALFNDTPTCIQEDWVIHEGLPVFHDGDHVIHT